MCWCDSFRTKSTKTRIETRLDVTWADKFFYHSEQNPLKQGLKHATMWARIQVRARHSEQNPLKQGLKLRCLPWRLFIIKSFRTKSTKTRIETLD